MHLTFFYIIHIHNRNLTNIYFQHVGIRTYVYTNTPTIYNMYIQNRGLLLKTYLQVKNVFIFSGVDRYLVATLKV